MAKPKLRGPYDDDYSSDAYSVECPADPDFATKQSFKDECDVNTVVKRWLSSGIPLLLLWVLPVFMLTFQTFPIIARVLSL